MVRNKYSTFKVVIDLYIAENLAEKTWSKFWAFLQSAPHIWNNVRSLRIVHNPIQHGETREQWRAIGLEPRFVMTLAFDKVPIKLVRRT